ncbi:MAG: hypothetical protein CGU28_03040 [Candidatus Dactylopiibacterium carminicum]|uniref:Sorbitol dehydrogenase n=1 Tax=Candidatus Dactylopiibacterium carminicum TaxID=857335 RepID=A0A272EYL9_9RHOO|nr:sugar dehydrogenase complex small subunit [Candidatus Dactylopiibacterium carminicum]KAF7600640.1 hypothetical protein BGI27_01785 [Candidatus Dactylopiibacterium carminicum]PAS95126.1 MAG: hypothetical protein CGU29_01385 [Candidatus Dactylopiibacterium carminicum]PAS97930.1 MAG: hypothetical protein CGU28_03040 [Candidatus Dactylopiibacterium carminicum]PAT00637.1 MAG: hypothetical protein BSR46_01795 [Candidatus Dactylopiibacterium carminicum]
MKRTSFAGEPRRTILKGLGLLAGASAFPAVMLPAFAAAEAADDFVVISRMLTGREALSAEFAAALLQVFSRLDADFPAKLARLRSYVTQKQVDAAALADQLQADAGMADLAGLPKQILSGWYLGVVGSGARAICVTYTEALAHKCVADVLRPPSYAYGAYGTWAAKPF